MGNLFSYSIAAGITLLVLYIVYKWLLASENQPRLNRIALMVIYVISFAMPLIPEFRLHFATAAPPAAGTIGIGTPQMQIVGEGVATGGFDWLTAVLWIYATGIFIVTMRTILTAIKLYTLVKNGIKIYSENYVTVYIDRSDIAPFSWGRYIVMNSNEEARCATMIATHELAHIKARHFIDLLISQLTCILLWYNPASWLMQTELKAVHEYEADERVLQSGCNAREYQLLLVKKAVGQRFPSLANSLNHSKLKKRITMMYSKKTSASRKTRVLALVPAALLGFMLLNVPAVSNAMATASSASMSVNSPGESKVTTNSDAAQPSAAMQQEEVLKAAQEMPEFEGGVKGLMSFLVKNITYPEAAEKAGIEGYVVVRFTVTKTGDVQDIELVRAVDPSLDAEAIRVVKATAGKWKPGKVNGEEVNVHYTLPISFKLPKPDKTK